MSNPKIDYLKQLLSIYHSKGCGEFINSKLLSIKIVENSFFCFGCSRTFIPKINCCAKFDDSKFIIKCKGCGKITKLDTME